MTPETFGSLLLAALRVQWPEAVALRCRRGRGAAEVGVDAAGTWVPLLRLTGASKACNVMTLLARQGRGWTPTFARGTPAELATQLSGSLQHLWRPAVLATDMPDDP